MATESSQSLTDTLNPKPEDHKNKETIAAIDMDDFDNGTNEDDMALPPEDGLATKKMDARRKIEMYWEKKRLQEQLDDYGEVDFDF
jgi:hypothetical protein